MEITWDALGDGMYGRYVKIMCCMLCRVYTL